MRRVTVVAVLLMMLPACTWTRYMLELRRQQRGDPYIPEPSHACLWPDGTCSTIRPSRCRERGGCVQYAQRECVEGNAGDTFDDCVDRLHKLAGLEDPCLCIYVDDTVADVPPSLCRKQGGCVVTCRVTWPEVEGNQRVTWAWCMSSDHERWEGD